VGLELLEGTALWAALRFLMGSSIAAVLAIADAWMNGKTPSESRGRVIAVYSIVLGMASLLSQLIFLGIDAETDGFVLMFAVLMNIAVVLISLTSSKAPEITLEPAKPIRLVTITSVTATVAAFASGFAIVSITSIIPYYLTSHGVSG
jgi:MFS family permease